MTNLGLDIQSQFVGRLFKFKSLVDFLADLVWFGFVTPSTSLPNSIIGIRLISTVGKDKEKIHSFSSVCIEFKSLLEDELRWVEVTGGRDTPHSSCAGDGVDTP